MDPIEICKRWVTASALRARMYSQAAAMWIIRKIAQAVRMFSRPTREHSLLLLPRRPTRLVIAMILFASGCAGRPDIIVSEVSGDPVPGATITGTSLSISGQTSRTDARGRADIPWSIQGTKWIAVHKAGYQGVSGIDVERTGRPIRVVLSRSVRPGDAASATSPSGDGRPPGVVGENLK